jgi:hypothetical protein
MSDAIEPRTNILLLTATITPPGGVPLLARTDPALRRQDYETALAFYLTLLGGGVDHIVFAENSNSDVSTLRALADRSGQGGRVEFLVFDGLDHPPAYGRGYGEFKLVDHAVSRSRTVEAHRETAVVWKATGRYVVRNLGRIVRRGPPAFDLYCNCRNRPLRWVDLYLLAWSPRGYRDLIRGACEGLREDVNPASPEVRFRERIDAAPAGVTVVPRFNVTPRVGGVRGRDNQNYARGNNLLKFCTRAALRGLAPWLWV